jgi:Na+-transporting NADH:ubiquinone oxidoreductase subunit A
MQTIKFKKGFRFHIDGAPGNALTPLPEPSQVALLPSQIAHIKPRLKVAEGETVRIGSTLVEDKRNPAIQFLSPGGGKVRRIQFGPRHRIESIVIDLDAGNESALDFQVIRRDEVDRMDHPTLVSNILRGGLWWILRELPFRDLPDPETIPPRIIVGLSTREPFHPHASVYLKDQEDMLDFGLGILQKLTPGPVLVCGDAEDTELIQHHGKWLTHAIKGHYPANDPGTFNFRLKASAAQNRSWMVTGQDLLLLAQFFTRGRYPTERVVAVAGSHAPAPQHFLTRTGAPLALLAAPGAVPPGVRWVLGGLMQGYASSADGFLGLRETSLTLLPEADQARFLALFNPGYSAPTYSRTFLSKIRSAPLQYDCNLHGEERACIACMHCADVCPVDILPHMAYKSILAEEVEEYLAHGLLDCVECGLCSYVCPSKIELCQTFKAAKAAYAKEQLRAQEN